MNDYRDRFASLSPQQRALLNLRLSQRQAAPTHQAIERKSATNLYPLSFEQEQLWFLTQLDPQSPVHNLGHTFVLQGSLDAEALARSFDELVRRHEALRTTFVERDGRPLQLVGPARPGQLSHVDLGHFPEAEAEARARQLANDLARRPFDLARGPLMRAVLLRLGDERHFLLLTLHHIVTDWWSFKILYRELSTLYGAFSRGLPSPLAELPIHYGDFAAWQRDWMRGEVPENLLAYWKRQLGGAPPLLALPTDNARPAVQTFRGRRHFFPLPKRLLKEFESLSRRANVTLFTSLLAAFQTLLHRYTGQTDVLVGTPSANRHRAELEPLIGFFLNTLVLRADFSRNPSFEELLAEMRQVTVGAYAHQQLPFRKLVEELQPERSLSFMPVFQVNFIFLTAQNPAQDSNASVRSLLNLSNVSVSALETEVTASQLDLSLALEARDGGPVGFFEYNTDIFHQSTVERMARHLRNLMEAVAADPRGRVGDFEFLDEAERDKLLYEVNDTATAFPQHQCIHELFEQQAERTPEAVALMHGEEALTYRELNRRANGLAVRLKSMGVGPEARVGIEAERSPEMIVGLLAILKAGGAYVPLDPSYPAERLSYIIEDAQVSVVLKRKPLDDNLKSADARRCVYLERDTEADGAQGVENVDGGATPDNLAYVIYTSGSTGTPKGVAGPHRGAVNRFRWMWDAYPFEAGEVCCQKTSLNFIDSVWEVFGPLLRGVPLLLVDDEVLKDPEALVELLSTRRVTRITLVPSLLRVLLERDVDLRRRLPELKYWVSSGEALSQDLARLFFERLPESVLINLYGSSEVCADATCCELSSKPEASRVSLGRPIANVQCYVLDAMGRPAPAGVYGELHVGGEGLARGYHRRPALTAERFIPHPFARRAGERLYRTGDIARFLDDGRLEYAGRNDRQIKLRGFRIEPGEIEATLARHPRVSEAVVAARDDGAGEKRLVAYLTLQEMTDTTRDVQADIARELRELLERRLPHYMSPAAFVILDKLPQTPNGKVDYKALPAPEPQTATTDAAHLSAASEIEQIIAGIWKEVLGLESVNVHDNFFALGGHSLLMFQVHDRLRRAFNKELRMTSMFQHPTVSSLADYIARENLAGDAR